MRLRIVILVAMIAAFAASDVSAACVSCQFHTCQNIFGQEAQAARCIEYEIEYGEGVSNCKNVGTCGGCMGWSCSRDGEVPHDELVPETITIEIVAERPNN